MAARVSYATQKAVPFPPLLVDGNNYFSNVHLAALVLGVPVLLIRFTPFIRFGFWTYILYTLVFGLPITCAYWLLSSTYGAWVDKEVKLPNRPQSDYFTIKDAKLREKYADRKIPMQIWHDAYFAGKIDIKMDMLELLEYRYDWANFHFTLDLLKYVIFTMLPEVVVHSKTQDEEQVRDHYDRGDDFYEWFLGPRMIYTSGVISDPNANESLEQLQDNKLAIVCEKLDLKPEDKLLDIGCGWGTLAAFAGKNYGCDVTGVTLARNQTKFGTDRLRKNGVPEEKGRILCKDYREIPDGTKFNKIVSLEMFEHIGIRHYSGAMREFYNLLEDDGTMFVQVSGFRPNFFFHDLI